MPETLLVMYSKKERNPVHLCSVGELQLVSLDAPSEVWPGKCIS